MKAKITGMLFDDTPKYYDWDEEKKYPTYDIKDKQKFVIDADSLDDARNWFIEHYPHLYIGCNIQMENGNFLIEPVLDYYVNIFETTNRDEIIKRIKDIYNI